MSECKIDYCKKEAVMKGFCTYHYVKYAKKEIDINGDNVKKHLKLPQNWNNKTIHSKLKHIKNVVNVSLLKHIYLKDSNDPVKFHAGKRLLELGETIPENKNYSCKIYGCKGRPNAYGHFVRGFCGRHYHHYVKGIIDINGNEIRSLVDKKDKKRVTCKVKSCKKPSYKDCFCAFHYEEYRSGLRDVHGKSLVEKYKSKKSVERPLARFNRMLHVLAFMKKELRELRERALLDVKINEDLKKQISFIEDNLKFIHNPSFILGSITLLDNKTLKVLLGGEKGDPINVNIELKGDKGKREFKGTLIKGNNANIAITEYEILDEDKKISETVLFLKDKINSVFPFECEAKDLQGNIVHRIKITESE